MSALFPIKFRVAELGGLDGALGGLVWALGGFVRPGQHAASAEVNPVHVSCGAIGALWKIIEPNAMRFTCARVGIVEVCNPWLKRRYDLQARQRCAGDVALSIHNEKRIRHAVWAECAARAHIRWTACIALKLDRLAII